MDQHNNRALGDPAVKDETDTAYDKGGHGIRCYTKTGKDNAERYRTK